MSQGTTGNNVPNSPPSAQLMQMIFGFMTSQAISVAAKLGIADLLKDEAKSADELSQATGMQTRPLYRILRALASVGIFAEDDAGRFRMTPLAEPLRGDVPDSLRDFLFFWARTGTGQPGVIFLAAPRTPNPRSRGYTGKPTLIIWALMQALPRFLMTP